MSLFNNAAEDMAAAYLGTASAPTGTLKVALMNGYTFDETDVFWSDVSANEASGSGYTAGGQALDNVSVTQDDAANGAYIDHDNETFSSVSVTANGAMYYFDTGTPATSKLFTYIPFASGSQTVNDGTIVVTPPATGIELIARA